MAHRHIAQRAAGGRTGGREHQAGNKEVFAAASQGNAPGVRATAAKREGGPVVGKAGGGRLDRRARGGGVGSDKSPFSSAAFSRGGGVKKK